VSYEYEKFPKIRRLDTVCVRITEKIDGTNGLVVVPEDPSLPLIVGSRNRVITPISVSGNKASDNFGFAQFVLENEKAFRDLGPGKHYGEWYGQGIGRTYGLSERRFALFNTQRPLPEGSILTQVPLLYIRQLNGGLAGLQSVMEALQVTGSKAVPGYMQPEGIVVTVDNVNYKVVFNKTGPSPEEVPGD
jgi:hypothetical protein